MIQSIASMAVQMQQENLEAEVAVRTAQKVLDTARLQGEALVDMIDMQSEIYSHLGKNISTLA
jgi:hypothetical protein